MPAKLPIFKIAQSNKWKSPKNFPHKFGLFCIWNITFFLAVLSKWLGNNSLQIPLFGEEGEENSIFPPSFLKNQELKSQILRVWTSTYYSLETFFGGFFIVKQNLFSVINILLYSTLKSWIRNPESLTEASLPAIGRVQDFFVSVYKTQALLTKASKFIFATGRRPTMHALASDSEF